MCLLTGLLTIKDLGEGIVAPVIERNHALDLSSLALAIIS
jgi:hypothetical protein